MMIEFRFAGSIGKAKIVTDVGTIYRPRLASITGQPEIGLVGRRHDNQGAWFATPDLDGDVFDLAGNTACGFEHRRYGATWLAGIWWARHMPVPILEPAAHPLAALAADIATGHAANQAAAGL